MAKLVAIGDSMVQGAMSLAGGDTKNSFVYMLAKSLGLPDSEFVTPVFDIYGGLPVNLEWLLRKIESKFGKHITFWEWPQASIYIAELLDLIEDYWERGAGKNVLPDKLYHNLGLFGFQVADAYSIDSTFCQNKIKDSKDNLFQPPSFGWLRLAKMVLNPADLLERRNDTQIRVAKRIREQGGGIDNLILCTGSNNCLNTVFKLLVDETSELSPGPDSEYTLWRPELFKSEFLKLVEKINEIAADKVYLCTVPPVFAMPIAKGIMSEGQSLPHTDGYFDYYVKPWMDFDNFNIERDRYLTGFDARAIDNIIIKYNNIIKNIAADNGYYVIDLYKVVESSWYDKYRGNPPAILPPAISDLDSRYLKINSDGLIEEGGLVSLDGMHPTLCGYGIMAQECVDIFRSAGETVSDIDFYKLRQKDSLVSNPPLLLNDMMSMMKHLEKYFHLSRWLRVSMDNGLVF